MPEATIATPPAPAAPAATETKPLTGSALFESQMDALKEAPPQPAKPAEKAAPAKPESGKPAISRPKPDKVEPKPADKPAPTTAEKLLDWKTAPAEFRTAHEKLLATHQQTLKEKETEVGRLQSRLAELDRREFLSPEAKAEYQKKEERLAKLESELYSRDYEQSPEFKEKYETPWKNKYLQALTEVKGLQVKFTDGDEEKARAATQADFDRVLDAPTLTLARRIAKEQFGEDADVVLQYRTELRQIKESGDRAIAEKKNSFQETRKQTLEKMQADGKTYESKWREYDQALVQKYPDFFGDDPSNPQLADAIKQGLEFVDSATKGADQMPMEERAKVNSLVRRWAASWPRDQVIIKQLREQVAAKDEELSKYRKSSPGGEEGGVAKEEEAGKISGGTKGLIAEMEKKLG